MSQHLMIDIVLFFFGGALLLYMVFGGADFGGGILECWLGPKLREEQRHTIAKAMGPVWEANHVWLILAVVILFVAFAEVYARLSISLHLPITALLVGITLRGCAFTFRAYDAVQSEGAQRWYTRLFCLSSVLSPFFIGLIVGGASSGLIPVEEGSFRQVFIAPWYNTYSAAIGLFAIALFALVAAVFLCDESSDAALRQVFKRRVRAANAAAVIAGLLVFGAAAYDGVPLIGRYLASPWSLACIGLTTLLLVPLHLCLERQAAPWLTRTLGAALLALVLLGWFAAQYPMLMQFEQGKALNAYDVAAPAATLKLLIIALLAGSCLILPALGWLFLVFKGRRPAQPGVS